MAIPSFLKAAMRVAASRNEAQDKGKKWIQDKLNSDKMSEREPIKEQKINRIADNKESDNSTTFSKISNTIQNNASIENSHDIQSISYLQRMSDDLFAIKNYLKSVDLFNSNDGKTNNQDLSKISNLTNVLKKGFSFFGKNSKFVAAIKSFTLSGSTLAKSMLKKGVSFANSPLSKISTFTNSIVSNNTEKVDRIKGNILKNNPFKNVKSMSKALLDKGSPILKTAGQMLTKSAPALLEGAIAAAPALAVGAAGFVGFKAGEQLNKALEGTDIGEWKNRLFESIFTGIDELTGGLISGVDSKKDNGVFQRIGDNMSSISDQIKASLGSHSAQSRIMERSVAGRSTAVDSFAEKARNLTGAKPITGTEGLGGLSALYESGRKGSGAIGRDSTGGTSYGKYQISSKTMPKFLNYLKNTDPEIYNRLSAAGPIDGGVNGQFANEWRSLAKEGKLKNYEHDFIKKTHFDVATNGLKNQELRDKIANNKALQDVLWSTSVQHGGGASGGGAADIFNKVYKDGMSDDDLIKSVYSERSKHFGSSTANVRASVLNRFKDEQSRALAMANSPDATIAMRKDATNSIIDSGVGNVNNALMAGTQDAINRNVKYNYGSKNSATGEIDCSGWVMELNKKVCAELGNPDTIKQSVATMKDGAAQGGAAGIIKAVGESTGKELSGSDVNMANLKEGMLVGMDYSKGGAKSGQDRYKGIDHITQVVKDPNTGEMMISESSSKKGVHLTNADEWLTRNKNINKFAVDPYLNARNEDGSLPLNKVNEQNPFIKASYEQPMQQNNVQTGMNDMYQYIPPSTQQFDQVNYNTPTDFEQQSNFNQQRTNQTLESVIGGVNQIDNKRNFIPTSNIVGMNSGNMMFDQVSGMANNIQQFSPTNFIKSGIGVGINKLLETTGTSGLLNGLTQASSTISQISTNPNMVLQSGVNKMGDYLTNQTLDTDNILAKRYTPTINIPPQQPTIIQSGSGGKSGSTAPMRTATSDSAIKRLFDNMLAQSV